MCLSKENSLVTWVPTHLELGGSIPCLASILTLKYLNLAPFLEG